MSEFIFATQGAREMLHPSDKRHHKLHQPDKLQHWANITTAKWFLTQAGMMIQTSPQYTAAALSKHLTHRRHYFDQNMPKCKLMNDTIAQTAVAELMQFRQHFNQQVLKNNEMLIANGVDVIGRMIEVIFADKLMRLQAADLHFTLFRTTFCLKSYMFTNLVDLSIHIPTGRKEQSGDLEMDIINFIKGLHNLKYLAIIGFCSNNVLNCIASNCPLVEELNVSHSDDVTDCSMYIISELSNLRIIIMNGARKVTEKGIRTLLEFCENIEHIGLDGTSKIISWALHGVANYVINPSKRYLLKTYTSYNDTFEQLAAVVHTCPRIQHLIIDLEKFNKGRENERARFLYDLWHSYRIQLHKNLFIITDLNSLSELSLRNCSFYENEVDKILQLVGHKLTSLNFGGVSEMNVNALIQISQTCPNLETVSFNYCHFSWDPTLSDNELNKLTFKNLKNVDLDCSNEGVRGNASSEPSEYVASEISFMLFSNCLNVENIHVRRGLWLTEHTMSRILDKNPLKHLKLLEIGYGQNRHEVITAPILARIVENCINTPTIIEMNYEMKKATN